MWALLCNFIDSLVNYLQNTWFTIIFTDRDYNLFANQQYQHLFYTVLFSSAYYLSSRSSSATEERPIEWESELMGLQKNNRDHPTPSAFPEFFKLISHSLVAKGNTMKRRQMFRRKRRFGRAHEIENEDEARSSWTFDAKSTWLASPHNNP